MLLWPGSRTRMSSSQDLVSMPDAYFLVNRQAIVRAPGNSRARGGLFPGAPPRSVRSEPPPGRPELYHQSDEAFGFDEGVGMGHGDCIDLFPRDGLPVAAPVQTFLVDQPCNLFGPHAAVGRSENVQYGFFQFHSLGRVLHSLSRQSENAASVTTIMMQRA